MVALHAADLLAVWVQTAQQNPVVVQLSQNPVLVQSVPEKGLAIASWVGPVISGLLSFFVAWMVFKSQARKERRQWIRDQKKNEWSQLLRCIAELQRILIPSHEFPEEHAKQIVQQLLPAVREIWIAAESSVFNMEFLRQDGNRKRLEGYLSKAADGLSRVRQMLRNTVNSYELDDQIGHITTRRVFAKDTSERFEKLVNELTDEFRDFLSWVRKESLEDLSRTDQ